MRTTIQFGELHTLLADGIETAREHRQRILVSMAQQVDRHDPITFFSSGKAYSGERTFWSDPTKELTLVGIGSALTFETEEAEDRFQYIEREWEQLLKNSIIKCAENVPASGPALIGGFSFDPYKRKTALWESYPAAKMTLPKYLLTIYRGKTYLTVNRVVADSDDAISLAHRLIEEQTKLCQSTSLPELTTATFQKEEINPQAWLKSVEKATADIQNNELEKIVLARELRIFSNETFSPETILLRLQKEQPFSYLFAFESGNDCFIGASPERLIKQIGEKLYFTCLAGSIKRGENEQTDEQLGSMLLNDRKNLHEHKLVVDMITDIVSTMSKEIDIPPAPTLYKMRDIQHLYTPIKAKSAEESMLSILKALHPTPALGGSPQKLALERIRETEELDRGWYAAPIGWLDHQQNGEFAAAIRSALLSGKQASLFAGCGIVRDSELASEYDETNIKFRPMLSALGEKGDG